MQKKEINLDAFYVLLQVHWTHAPFPLMITWDLF
jgi:hypothetical protein